MSGNFARHIKIAAAVIAVAVLAGGFFISPVYADDKNPTPAPQPQPAQSDKESSKAPESEYQPKFPKGYEKIKTGKREDTESLATSVEKAYYEYQKMCSDGTEEQKTAAMKKWRDLKFFLEQVAVNDEAQELKNVREAYDNRMHYDKLVDALEKNPNSSASDLAKARLDAQKAFEKWRQLSIKEGDKIRAELRKQFIYDGPESCPAPSETTPPPEEKQKKKKNKNKNKGDTSGPLDFFGDVTIGIGVGEHGERHHDEIRHDDKAHQDHERDDHKEKLDEPKEKKSDNVPHEPDHQDHDDNQPAPAPKN